MFKRSLFDHCAHQSLEFVQFADELKNMLLHIIRLEAKALPKRPAIKQHRAARAPRTRGSESGRGEVTNQLIIG